jgi:hypothetical protein
VCSGWGFELIWWILESLFTNVICVPGATVTFFGLTPVEEMVIVTASPPGLGDVAGSLPPQAIIRTDAASSVDNVTIATPPGRLPVTPISLQALFMRWIARHRVEDAA